MFSTRVHLPTFEFQPMMEFAIHEWSRTTALERIAHRCSLTPGPILAPAPTTTLGPRTAVGSTSAVCCQLAENASVQLAYRVNEDVSAINPFVLCGVRKKRRVGSSQM
jgi:hypothetical protein